MTKAIMKVADQLWIERTSQPRGSSVMIRPMLALPPREWACSRGPA